MKTKMLLRSIDSPTVRASQPAAKMLINTGTGTVGTKEHGSCRRPPRPLRVISAFLSIEFTIQEKKIVEEWDKFVSYNNASNVGYKLKVDTWISCAVRRSR